MGDIREKAKNEIRLGVVTEYRVASGGDGGKKITGHAAVFDSPSEDMGFVEIIRPGAFKKVLKKADCRALFNHDSNYVLGRTTSGTLTLAEDATGLSFEIDAPDTQTINDLVITPMERGDITQCSFGFRVGKDNWFMDGQTQHREILEVSELFDISVVTYPAYSSTDAQVRSAFRGAGIDYDELSAVVLRSQSGAPLTPEDNEILKASITVLQGIEARGVQQEQGTPNDNGGRALAELDVLRRRLELAALD